MSEIKETQKENEKENIADPEIVYEDGVKKIIDLEKVKFLSENVFPVRGIHDPKDFLKNDRDLQLRGHTTFITDEASLYEIISTLQPEIHVYGFSLSKLIERRYNGVKEALETSPEPTQDERYYASGLFKIDLVADPRKPIIDIYFIDFAGMDAIDI